MDKRERRNGLAMDKRERIEKDMDNNDKEREKDESRKAFARRQNAGDALEFDGFSSFVKSLRQSLSDDVIKITGKNLFLVVANFSFTAFFSSLLKFVLQKFVVNWDTQEQTAKERFQLSSRTRFFNKGSWTLKQEIDENVDLGEISLAFAEMNAVLRTNFSREAENTLECALTDGSVFLFRKFRWISEEKDSRLKPLSALGRRWIVVQTGAEDLHAVQIYSSIDGFSSLPEIGTGFQVGVSHAIRLDPNCIPLSLLLFDGLGEERDNEEGEEDEFILVGDQHGRICRHNLSALNTEGVTKLSLRHVHLSPVTTLIQSKHVFLSGTQNGEFCLWRRDCMPLARFESSGDVRTTCFAVHSVVTGKMLQTAFAVCWENGAVTTGQKSFVASESSASQMLLQEWARDKTTVEEISSKDMERSFQPYGSDAKLEMAFAVGGDYLVTVQSGSSRIDAWVCSGGPNETLPQWRKSFCTLLSKAIHPGTLTVSQTTVSVVDTEWNVHTWEMNPISQPMECLGKVPFKISKTVFIDQESIFVTGCENGAIYSWRVGQLPEEPPLASMLGLHTSKIVSFHESIDSPNLHQVTLWSLDAFGGLCLWDPIKGTCLRNLTSILARSMPGIAQMVSAVPGKVIVLHGKGIASISLESNDEEKATLDKFTFVGNNAESGLLNLQERPVATISGTLAAVSMRRSQLALIDLNDWKTLSVLALEFDFAEAMVFSGRWLGCLGGSGKLFVWDVSEPCAPVQVFEHYSESSAEKIILSRSTNGFLLQSIGPNTCRFFEAPFKQFNPAVGKTGITKSVDALSGLGTISCGQVYPDTLAIVHQNKSAVLFVHERQWVVLFEWLFLDQALSSKIPLSSSEILSLHFLWEIPDQFLKRPPPEVASNRIAQLASLQSIESVQTRHFFTFLILYGVWARAGDGTKLACQGLLQALSFDGKQDNNSKPGIWVEPHLFSQAEPLLVLAVNELVKFMPSLALDLFRLMPMLPARELINKGFSKLLDFNALGEEMVVAGDRFPARAGFWSKVIGDKVELSSQQFAQGTTSFVHPLLGASLPRTSLLKLLHKRQDLFPAEPSRHESLMENILASGESQFFQSVAVRSVVEHAWGRAQLRFFRTMARFLCRLVVVNLIVINTANTSGEVSWRDDPERPQGDLIAAVSVAFLVWHDPFYVKSFVSSALTKCFGSSTKRKPHKLHELISEFWKIFFESGFIPSKTHLRNTRKLAQSKTQSKARAILRRGQTGSVRVLPIQWKAELSAEAHVSDSLVKMPEEISKRRKKASWTARFLAHGKLAIQAFQHAVDTSGGSLLLDISFALPDRLSRVSMCGLVVAFFGAVFVLLYALILAAIFVLLVPYIILSDIYHLRIDSTTLIMLPFFLGSVSYCVVNPILLRIVLGDYEGIDRVHPRTALCTALVVLSMQELVQSKMSWGTWEMVRFLAPLSAIVFVAQNVFVGTAVSTGALSCTVFLHWIELLYFMQGFRSTAVHVRTIFAVIHDVRFFTPVIGTVLLAVTSALHVLLRTTDRDEFGSVPTSIFTVFNMLLLGVLEPDALVDDTEAPVFVTSIYLASVVLVPIILLNLLIAILSDSYERVQDKAENELFAMRAKIACQDEVPTGGHLFLNLLLPASRYKASGGRGMLNELKRHTEDVSETVLELVREVSAKLDQTYHRLDEMQQELDRMQPH